MTNDRSFNDHFSAGAQDYLRHRPTYPEALFAHLAQLAPSRERALDVACGNGQAALGLAPHFEEVVATDGSQAQLDHAVAHPKVHYRRALAEATGLEAGSVDLVTAAAGAHWFDLDRFFAEVRRVLRPGGVVALWTYDGAPRVTPEVEAEIQHLREHIAGSDWPPGFEYVRDGYRNLPFPFEALEPPALVASARWDVDTLLGHLRSWSAVQRHTQREGRDPVQDVEPALRAAWGPEVEARDIVWPLHFRIGRG